ncbi:hypothetical protein [Paenibacillus alkalitolerans]|uniref:hypothetical protein n=1 Tax=Paenibacillus alkalitolerans TaxID=2799335 RepID=UPI0018F6A115|nr:hypothetical protein [Paenibacillus alkalitolerans]
MVKASHQHVEEILASWSGKPLEGAREMISKYGLPDEATPSMLIWYNNGPWTKTVVFRETVPHNFPKPHPDFLEQTIKYEVPVQKFDDIGAFDGSVYIDRTKGTVSAKCHMEPMNILSLNLMNDIVTGKRSVEQARKFYADTVVKFNQGIPTPYTEKLLFPLPEKTGDPDVALVRADS